MFYHLVLDFPLKRYEGQIENYKAPKSNLTSKKAHKKKLLLIYHLYFLGIVIPMTIIHRVTVCFTDLFVLIFYRNIALYIEFLI